MFGGNNQLDLICDVRVRGSVALDLFAMFSECVSVFYLCNSFLFTSTFTACKKTVLGRWKLPFWKALFHYRTANNWEKITQITYYCFIRSAAEVMYPLLAVFFFFAQVGTHYKFTFSFQASVGTRFLIHGAHCALRILNMSSPCTSRQSRWLLKIVE